MILIPKRRWSAFFGTSGRPGSVGRLDNRLVCVRFLTQNRKSDCSENRNRRFHVCVQSCPEGRIATSPDRHPGPEQQLLVSAHRYQNLAERYLASKKLEPPNNWSEMTVIRGASLLNASILLRS